MAGFVAVMLFVVEVQAASFLLCVAYLSSLCDRPAADSLRKSMIARKKEIYAVP